jgi:hypothetical protein
MLILSGVILPTSAIIDKSVLFGGLLEALRLLIRLRFPNIPGRTVLMFIMLGGSTRFKLTFLLPWLMFIGDALFRLLDILI